MGRMTASQDSHATSSVMKESVVRGHHVYKVAAASLVVFSAHSTAFNLKETPSGTVGGFRTLRCAPCAFKGTASRCVKLYIDSC